MITTCQNVAAQQENGFDQDGPPPCKKQKSMPKGETLLQRRKKSVASSQHLHYGDYPLKITKGLGQYLYDENGEQYLDTINNVSHVGHCHPKVVEAGAKQMATLNTNSRFLYDKIVTYAEHLSKTFPDKLSCCFFTNSGSEANDLALQVARRVSGHKHVISLDGAYHGHLASLKPLSTHKLGGQGQPEEEKQDVSLAPMPDVFRGKYRDPETAGHLYAREVKAIMDDVATKGGKIAAFIHESIPSCAGQVFLPEHYLKEVYDNVHAAGGLCIADEIQTGFGRVGKHFWGFELQGVCPDIVTLGKPMGNGHPVAAVVMSKEIADRCAASGLQYFNTFGGNPVSMAVADSVLSVIEEEGLQHHAEEVGSYLLQGLEGLMKRHSCIGDVRGVGLFIGVELVKDRESKEPDKELTETIVKWLLLDHHIIALADGIHGNVIKIKPPMCITLSDCQHIVKSMGAVLTKLGE